MQRRYVQGRRYLNMAGTNVSWSIKFIHSALYFPVKYDGGLRNNPFEQEKWTIEQTG